MKFDRKKVYYKILKRKNKQYLTLVQRHKYLFENQLFKFVPDQSTPTNKKFNGVYLDKNKLIKLMVSKGLNPAPQIMTCVFNASPDLKNFNDVLAFSQSIAMLAKAKCEKSENPYLMTGNKKSIVRLHQLFKDKAKRGINKVLRKANMEEMEGLPEWTPLRKPDPRILRKKGPQIYYEQHIGPKGVGYDSITRYRSHGYMKIARLFDHDINRKPLKKNQYLVKRKREKAIAEWRKEYMDKRVRAYFDAVDLFQKRFTGFTEKPL
jgi:hypothetical protein